MNQSKPGNMQKNDALKIVKDYSERGQNLTGEPRPALMTGIIIGALAGAFTWLIVWMAFRVLAG